MHASAILRTRDDPAVVLVRLLVGLVVFFPEGLQKLAFPALPLLGALRPRRRGAARPVAA